jgi:predicted metal-dependent hydrolase
VAGDRIELGALSVEVVRKRIKNIHLSVYPPAGRVRISAPKWMALEAVRLFAVSKLGWIRKQQQKLREQERETPREYLDRESHYVWGRRVLLEIADDRQGPTVELLPGKLVLRVRPEATLERRRAIVDEWYREQIKQAAPELIAKWEPILGVKVAAFFVRKMKTLWGSCTVRRHTIRLNSELAKKPPECLEYIVVHEMVHLLEQSHGPRFVALMDRHLPKWRSLRADLNRLPTRHEDWAY